MGAILAPVILSTHIVAKADIRWKKTSNRGPMEELTCTPSHIHGLENR